MTVREAMDLVIYAGAVCGAIFAIWALLRTFVVKPIKTNAARESNRIRDSIKLLDTKVDGLGQRLSDHITTHGP